MRLFEGVWIKLLSKPTTHRPTSMRSMRFIALLMSSSSSGFNSSLQSARVLARARRQSSHPSVNPFGAKYAGRKRKRHLSAFRSQNLSERDDSIFQISSVIVCLRTVVISGGDGTNENYRNFAFRGAPSYFPSAWLLGCTAFLTLIIFVFEVHFYDFFVLIFVSIFFKYTAYFFLWIKYWHG